jgi:hypothetical protein
LGISNSEKTPLTSDQITASLVRTFRKTVTVDVKSNGLIEIKPNIAIRAKLQIWPMIL